MKPEISVIIPAHNEESTIATCLTELLPLIQDGQAEIIVGCNGCTDQTAATARAIDPAIQVVETGRPSKPEGLNLADSLAQGSFRIYLDADIQVSGQALRTLVERMKQTGVCAAAPSMRVNLEQSSPLVQAFYAVWTQLPYFANQQMIGSGIFALSPQGRQRFKAFPDVIADDGYVRTLFKAHERKTFGDCHFTLQAPRHLWGLIRIKTRARLGNMQLGQCFPEQKRTVQDTTTASLMALLRGQPSLVLAMVVYIAVQLITLLRANWQFSRSEFDRWERDDSSRESSLAAPAAADGG